MEQDKTTLGHQRYAAELEVRNTNKFVCVFVVQRADLGKY
jgi:hypothetical protein